MKPTITIHNYTSELLGLNQQAFTHRLDTLINELSKNQPRSFRRLIQASINNGTKPWISDSNRDRAFLRLMNYNLSELAHETFENLTKLLDSPVDQISCYIVPAIDTKGGGLCFAPGQMLLAIQSDDLSPLRLQRNIAHEYSHTIRMAKKPQETAHGFGEAIPYSVRDYLIFEGLASVLDKTLFPGPLPTFELSEEQEALFWEKVDLDATGMDAYIEYMSMTAYEIGSRIVRQYLRKHNISIIEAHHLSDEELYWNSGYLFIQ